MQSQAGEQVQAAQSAAQQADGLLHRRGVWAAVPGRPEPLHRAAGHARVARGNPVHQQIHWRCEHNTREKLTPLCAIKIKLR